jgi:DNA-binding transcriptional regulator YiaG
MRIDTADGHHYMGTPTRIVRDMRESDFRTTADLDAFMKRDATEFRLGEIAGKDLDERCEKYVIASITKGLVHGIYVSDAPDSLDGDAIRVMRRVRGLTIAKLAQDLGVAAMTISRWESGENVPDPERHDAIVRALFEPRYQIRPAGASIASESASAPTVYDVRARVRAMQRGSS